MAEPQPQPDAEHSDDDEEGPFRRCIVSYERRHPDEMLRFVVSPTHEVPRPPRVRPRYLMI